jgi:hypothetical protein
LCCWWLTAVAAAADSQIFSALCCWWLTAVAAAAAAAAADLVLVDIRLQVRENSNALQRIFREHMSERTLNKIWTLGCTRDDAARMPASMQQLARSESLRAKVYYMFEDRNKTLKARHKPQSPEPPAAPHTTAAPHTSKQKSTCLEKQDHCRRKVEQVSGSLPHDE